MGVKVITDSTSDFLPADAGRLDIELVPLKVTFGEEEYIDKFTITNEEFYRKLKASRHMPTTTLVNPEQFVEVFSRYKDDDIVGIFISHKLSGTFQSAVIAKETLGRDNIHLIDSGTVTVGAMLLVYEAIRLRDQGKSAGEISRAVRALVPRVSIYGVVETLEYLVKGGRMSAARGFLGGALGIKPVLYVKDGVVRNIAKIRGVDKAIRYLEEEVYKKGRVDTDMPVAFAHAGNPAGLDLFMECFPTKNERHIASVGSVVGTHAGPGVSAVAVFDK